MYSFNGGTRSGTCIFIRFLSDRGATNPASTTNDQSFDVVNIGQVKDLFQF